MNDLTTHIALALLALAIIGAGAALISALVARREGAREAASELGEIR